MIKQYSDDDLIKEIMNESEEALKYLLDRYSSKLKSYLYTFNLPEYESEEIIHVIFTKFVINISKYNFNFKFSTYIFRLAHNEAISLKRFFKKSFITFDETINNSKVSTIDKIENCDYYEFLLSKLSKKERQIILLKSVENMKYEEISKITSISVGTLKSLYSRTIKKLRIIIDKSDLQIEDF